MVDGRSVRGARNTDGSQVHLLATLAGERDVVAAQTEVGAKTNEILMIISLDGLDLAGTVITAAPQINLFGVAQTAVSEGRGWRTIRGCAQLLFQVCRRRLGDRGGLHDYS